MNGGCYEMAKYPGKSVCTATKTGGTCQTSADGYKLDGSNNLVTCSRNCKVCNNDGACTTCMPGYVVSKSDCIQCAAGCATCAGTAATCDICTDGYYKSGSKCIACSKSEASIIGVSDCASCAPPASGTGSVLCYFMNSDVIDPDNKSSLSTGVIAGISVAAVVVVGGLVGFLCWWFLCRGKA
ncbi:VSP [Giardia duodenalis ATCC 50581]|nr:VSP [Giardia intestinalis ATCC 50581]